MKYIQLHLNESFYAVSRTVVDAVIASIKQSNRYPMHDLEEVYQELGHFFDVPAENLLLTQGIDESVDLLLHSFPEKRFVTLSPGFSGYKGRINLKQRSHLTLKRTLESPLPDATQLQQLTKNDFIMVANPCNPTGIHLNEEQLNCLFEYAGGSLLDLTYLQFSDGSLAKMQPAPDKFYFFSLSKSFSLASMRLGILIGDSEIIRNMRQQQWFCHFSGTALAAVMAILKEKDWLMRNVEIIKKERNRVFSKLKSLGLNVWPTETNFLLLSDADRSDIRQFLKSRGILVKSMVDFGLDDWLRVTVGTPDENEQLICALGEYVTSCA